MSLTGNKGEWSEIYVLLYLLSTAKLFSADDNLEQLSDEMFFPILSIFRTDGGRNIRFDTAQYITKYISIFVNDKLIRNLSSEVLAMDAKRLYNAINNAPKADGAFEIDFMDDVMNSLECTKLKAPSKDKTDIDLKIHDYKTGYTGRYGFSIKSQLGCPSTLLNASKATNFKYEICGMNDILMAEINSIETREKITDRINAIYNNNAFMKFVSAENKCFSSNLMLIDSLMEKIVGEILLKFYQKKSQYKKCNKIVSLIENDNPLGFPQTGFYSYKFKKLLCSVALGMMPAKNWDGRDDANGGYIIVKRNGDVLAYHIYNRDHFENYLYQNTQFETPSTSRHQFMNIYKINEKFYINLNLQIRFS